MSDILYIKYQVIKIYWDKLQKYLLPKFIEIVLVIRNWLKEFSVRFRFSFKYLQILSNVRCDIISLIAEQVVFINFYDIPYFVFPYPKRMDVLTDVKLGFLCLALLSSVVFCLETCK